MRGTDDKLLVLVGHNGEVCDKVHVGMSRSGVELQGIGGGHRCPRWVGR